MNPKIEKLKQEQTKNNEEIQKLTLKNKPIDHELQRAENQKAYLAKKERASRTHHLCNIGGTVEHFFPLTKSMTREELYSTFEKLSEITEVQILMNGGDYSSRSIISTL